MKKKIFVFMSFSTYDWSFSSSVHNSLEEARQAQMDWLKKVCESYGTKMPTKDELMKGTNDDFYYNEDNEYLSTSCCCDDEYSTIEIHEIEIAPGNGQDELQRYADSIVIEGEDGKLKHYHGTFNDGCYYIHTQINKEFDIQDIRNKHQGDDSWETDDAIDEEIYDSFDYSAFQCLYIVVDDEGNERLKYYRFSNGGCAFDDDQAEPDHDYVSKLSLIDLSFIIAAIEQNP